MIFDLFAREKLPPLTALCIKLSPPENLGKVFNGMIAETSVELDARPRLLYAGSHTFAVYILLSGQLQPHFQVLMGLGWDELKMLNPVRPGDELNLEMTVLEMRESKSRPDWGIVRNKNFLRNQKRETVLECFSTIFVARRPEANATSVSSFSIGTLCPRHPVSPCRALVEQV